MATAPPPKINRRQGHAAGKTVLQVTIDNGVMSVVRDGNTKATQVQDDMETTLGGLTMRIFAEKSKKFVSPIDRIKYAHLNIDFAHHFPADARGVFAELGGIQPMSQATSQLLRPHGHHDKPSSAISLLSPRKKEAVCICPPPPTRDCRRPPTGSMTMHETNLPSTTKTIPG